ncbi:MULTISPECIES: exodeoxyribonuclease VII large subunit [Francisella]|uniref:Exodeoxyribonuclease 7 large subunit n=1 Tax=Francisella opportunistica TaxID=2016517 RepID=A0A345JQU2_9GAMM|nr:MULTISPECIES: exodeoxyribonuclease VII large subunit [Francisella]APC91397.1 Exodeoxyribonuclease VII large subunit [Francisella sp. MA067296]AXH29688.1 exodeoxyribonuclease VII large subunit [Francisella opportunistica]AXH31338.1 exodeoxyribonuclease VII large subunit [Francisella opportunistica]AXH32984.1 exodeoxyribonuclease VII large subunit [Francisella opportunistica]
MQQSLKLSEFLELIKSTIEMSFGYEGFWIVAELSEWRKSGKHYYGELIEHEGISKYPIAKIRCNCWANKADYIHNKFSLATGEKLSSDMKVLLRVTVSYHISFGLSLNIVDIDPAFTLGDRQAHKIEILEKLAKKRILEKNKSLAMPYDFTSVAVITSKTAAGKGDFFEEADKLQNLGLCQFEIYEAKMQGAECAKSVSEAFAKIQHKADSYDAIVLTRGGGSQADLDWFNNIAVAESICNSKIPVMVGIGHERDTTVLDEICTKRFDTPSKVINFIANTIITNTKNAQHNYAAIVKITSSLVRQNKLQLDSLYHNFKTKIEHYLYQTNQNIEHNYKAVKSIARGLLKLYGKSIDMQYDKVASSSQNLIKNSQHNLGESYNHSINIAKNVIKYYNQASEYLYKQILSVSIEPTLRRGFSITKTQNGKYVTSQKQAQQYLNLEIVYVDGQVQVEVKDNGNTK